MTPAVRDWSFLAIALGASLAGFYVFPLAGQLAADGQGGPAAAVPPTPSEDLPSLLRYGIESIALGALCVVGAQQGVARVRQRGRRAERSLGVHMGC